MIISALLCLLVAPGAIANDDAYIKAGNSFQPFFELGNRAPFLCVGQGGVWIGGVWALSNAHCYDRRVIVPEYRNQFPADMVSGKSLSITTATAQESIPIVAAHVPEALILNDPFAYDLCLVQLARPPRIPGLKPAKLSSVTNLLGMRVVCVGYGELGLGSTGKDGNRFKRPHPGLRFGFENVIEEYTNLNAVARFIFDRKGLPLEGALSGGDSGTGMFAEVDGAWELVGINTHSGAAGLQHASGADHSIYGTSDGAVRIAPFAKELQEALRTNDPRAFVALTPNAIQERIRAMTPKTKLDRRPQPSDPPPTPSTAGNAR